MKTITLTITLLFYMGGIINAQSLEAGSGESSIIFGTSSFGFDITKAKLSLELNNFSTFKEDSAGILWGFSASAKNNDGSGLLYSSSERTNESSLSFKLGYFKSTEKDIRNFFNVENYKRIIKTRNQLNEQLENDLAVKTQEFNSIVQNDSNLTALEKKELLGIINTKMGKLIAPYTSLEGALKEEKAKPSLRAQYIRSLDNLLQALNTYDVYIQAKTIKESLDSSMDEALKKTRSVPYQKFSIHGFLTINRDEFSVFSAWDSTKPSNSFNEVDFSGLEAGINTNLRHNGVWYFGSRLALERTNNKSALSKTTFQRLDNTTLAGETYQVTKEITAFKGNYETLTMGRVHLDAARFFNIQKEIFMIADGYLRINKSFDEDLIKTTSDIGVAFSLFKNEGNFLGGFYVELPDIDQKLEAQKENPRYEDFYKRLSIGLYTKVSFQRFSGIPKSVND